ncbi:MAG TPA: heparan-alpha-glucosaminide N-acetyltransferase domain-containing protein, partial [Clostridia bacterium]|nr:heparan-alpha-glucosaminide N-acetyltransferase domain-containing protein [Clostridia bacterium]
IMDTDQVQARQRIPELDFLRGCALSLMMFHHAIGDLYEIYKIDFFAFQHHYWFYYVGQPLVLAVFLTVSGVSSRFSRNNMKRGLRMMLASLAMVALTITVDYFTHIGIILFNVIQVVTVSTLIYALIEKLAEKRGWMPPPEVAQSIGEKDVLPKDRQHIMVGVLIITGILGIFAASIIDPVLPEVTKNPLLVILGSAAEGIHVLDQMPLFPWIGFFLAGAAIGHTLYAPGLPLTKGEGFFHTLGRPFRFLGRHSLWVYLLHQPIFLLIFWLLSKSGVL